MGLERFELSCRGFFYHLGINAPFRAGASQTRPDYLTTPLICSTIVKHNIFKA